MWSIYLYTKTSLYIVVIFLKKGGFYAENEKLIITNQKLIL